MNTNLTSRQIMINPSKSCNILVPSLGTELAKTAFFLQDRFACSWFAYFCKACDTIAMSPKTKPCPGLAPCIARCAPLGATRCLVFSRFTEGWGWWSKFSPLRCGCATDWKLRDVQFSGFLSFRTPKKGWLAEVYEYISP